MITATALRAALRYDHQTGHFTWIASPRARVSVGDKAGCIAPDGYWIVSIGGHPYKAHRLAWLYVHGEWPTRIDHINRNRADNRICNLRLATYSQNAANRMSWNKHGLKGVSLNPRCKTKPYRATIEHQDSGKRVFRSLGVYKTKEEAHEAYLKAAREIHPEFASP